MIMARMKEEKSLTDVLWEKTAINANDPEDEVTMTMMIMALVTGSVLILKTNFMLGIKVNWQSGTRGSMEHGGNNSKYQQWYQWWH